MNSERIKFNVPKLPARIYSKTLGEVGYKCDLHYHNELEFIIIYSGEYIIEIDGVEHSARGGSIVFINSAVPHRTRATVDSVTALVQFNERDLISNEFSAAIKYSRKFLSAANPAIMVIRGNSELLSALEEIISETENRDSACDFYIKSAIYKTLGILYRSGILANPHEIISMQNMQKLMPVIAYINEHFDEDISLRSASDILNFDESYFCRLFKSATGTTFTEYLNFVRICKAEKMLTKTEMSILEVSEAVGFSSVSYFNRIFKKHRRLSPRAYRTLLYKNI